MKKLLLIFICLILLLSLSACAEQPHDTNYYFYLNQHEAPYKDGIFKLHEGVLGFFDLDSLEFQPLCNVEGCTHTDYSICNALCDSGLDTSLFVDGDNLYTLEAIYDETASIEALKPVYRTNLVLRDMSGEGKKVITYLKDVGKPSAVYVKSSVAYFSAESKDTKVPIETAYLYSADLATGEFKKIMTANEGVYNSISLKGIYDNKLYMNYLADGVAKCITYDFSSQAVEEQPQNVWRVYDDIMIIIGDDGLIEIITPEKKKSINNPEITNDDWFSPLVINNYMICSASGVAVELDTGEIKQTHQCTITAYYNGRYIVREADGSYSSLSQEELFTPNIKT